MTAVRATKEKKIDTTIVRDITETSYETMKTGVWLFLNS